MKRETTPFAWRYMHSRAYTCIHTHFGDFTFTQLRSFLLISLQLRLQFGIQDGSEQAGPRRPARCSSARSYFTTTVPRIPEVGLPWIEQ